MAALVQTIPQQAGTITLLQSRPVSASSSSFTTPIQVQHQSHLHHQAQMARNQTHARASYNGGNAHSSSPSGYRLSQPVAPYAFTNTPSLPIAQAAPSQQRQSQSQTQAQCQNLPHAGTPPRTNYSTAGSVSNSSSANSSLHSHISKDDSSLPKRHGLSESGPRPSSCIDLTLPISIPATTSTSSKPSPDRYRRGQRRGDQTNSIVATSVDSNNSDSLSLIGSGMAVATAQTAKSLTPSIVDIPGRPQSLPLSTNHTRGASADAAIAEHTTPSVSELAKRYRRRSLGSIENGFLTFPDSHPSPHPNEMSLSEFPLNGSPPSPKNTIPKANDTASIISSTDSVKSEKVAEPAATIQTNKRSPALLAPRSSEAPNRSSTPSPLSKPVDLAADETLTPDTNSKTTPNSNNTQEKQQEQPKPVNNPSPAAKRLIEISKKGHGKKSRLRRALSFSSVAELRGISTPEPAANNSRKQQLDEELSPEQAAIAAKQEAGGLGESIYSGQGNIFTGSTDNISVSSTASSASIMLRKMSNGVKRSTRSLVGLFRPKSVYNMPTDTSKISAPVPQVSMVTVEAQRDIIAAGPPVLPEIGTVRPDSGSGRHSVESDGSGIAERGGRKSIFGGDQERAEVLAAVRKGILKKTSTNSTNSSPIINPATDLPPVPVLQRRPESQRSSSAPSSAGGDRPPRSGHRRTDSVTIEGEDYFLPGGRFSAAGQSAPGTPHSVTSRNISFSPRIQFHDTWPSGEYDRRGEVATCNRLTPLLAQQIKEELNTFKMEMEVHESSKVYTHFF